ALGLFLGDVLVVVELEVILVEVEFAVVQLLGVVLGGDHRLGLDVLVTRLLLAVHGPPPRGWGDANGGPSNRRQSGVLRSGPRRAPGGSAGLPGSSRARPGWNGWSGRSSPRSPLQGGRSRRPPRRRSCR